MNFETSWRSWVKVLYLFLCLFILVSVSIMSIPNVLPRYLDEVVYISCGKGYVANFTPPYLCNFEHPPLGKYLIGFAELFGFGRFLYLFFMIGSSFLVLVLVRFLLGSDLLGFLAGSFLILDTVFFNSHRFLLLDPPAIFFTLLSLYFILVRSSLTASAFFFGLGVASKLSVAPYFIVLAYVLYRVLPPGFGVRVFLRRLLVFVGVAFSTYLATYVADFRLGPYTILQHHLDTFSYISWRHGFSVPVALNGLVKLISKIEVWRYGGEFTLIFSFVNSSLTLVNSTFAQGSGYLLHVGLGLGSILWYLMFPSLLINSYHVLTVRSGFKELLVCLAGWVSLTTILPGPLDWYYVNSLPALYVNTSLTIKYLVGGRERLLKPLITCLLGAQILITGLTYSGVIPYKIELPLPR